MTPTTQHDTNPDRRTFLKTGAAGAAALAVLPALSNRAYAAGEDVIKVGLIGCGGRGTGAAAQAMDADPGCRLYAMGDAFADHLDSSLKNLSASHKDKITVSDDRKFVGFDAFKKVTDVCDVVLLTSPPHFRPEHLAYAVEQGKHIFCEKPVAVDPVGIRSVTESYKKAAEKKLSLVSGLCWRYHPAIKAAMAEVHAGRIGDVVAIRCSYFAKQLNWYPRQESWSDMEWQIRDWQYFTWLSGDHIAEQHVHSLDKMLWALGDKSPVSASGVGGRLLREPGRGNVYDHFAVEYKFDDDVTGFGRCRQQDPSAIDVTDTIFGTKGRLQVASSRVVIEGEDPWRYRGEDGNMYQLEHDALFASIRKGEPINNGAYMTNSTMTALLGREAAYTGQFVKWSDLAASDMRLGPTSYEWGSIPLPPVRKPGDGAKV